MATVIERLRELFNGCDHNRANCYGMCRCDSAVHKAMPALLALADAVKKLGVYEITPCACHGDKCREPNCESCYDTDDVDKYVKEHNSKVRSVKSALAELEKEAK